MYHTFSGESFQAVEKTDMPKQVFLPAPKRTKFYGRKCRSTSGCFKCRLRKYVQIRFAISTNARKKCDEVHPVCTRCLRTKSECVWPEKKKPKVKDARDTGGRLVPKNTVKKGSRPQGESDVDRAILKSEKDMEVSIEGGVEGYLTGDIEINIEMDVRKNIEKVVEDHRDKKELTSNRTPNGLLDIMAPELSELTGVVHDLNEFKNDMLLEMQLTKCDLMYVGTPKVVDPPELHFPISADTAYLLLYLAKLDVDGLRYLAIYREQYSKCLAIGLDSLNYLLKTFFALATRDDAILYAVTAWGGFYDELSRPKGDFSRPWRYMQLAAKHICNSVGDNLAPTTGEEFFVLFSFYLIFIGIEVCTGDVRNWGGLLSKCAQLIQSYGGLAKVLEKFNYSSDIRFLMVNFYFRDMLSSNVFLHGPKYLMDEYCSAIPEDCNYGIDPLLGMLGPVYDLLGEVAHAKVVLAKKWNAIEMYLATDGETANEMRCKHYEEIERISQEFEERIAAVCPLESHINWLLLDPKMLDEQMALFELYIYVFRMQLATSINRMAPSSVHQQHLLMKALRFVDLLLPTKMMVALSFLLLVCGIMCVRPYDRDNMTRRFRQHMKQYKIGNFPRIVLIVTEAWARNPDGHQCIDWADLCAEKGWNLAVT